jgi:hypothetical protein
MKKIILMFILLTAMVIVACEKENVEPEVPISYLKATINGKEVTFNDFTFMGEQAAGNSRWQRLRGTTPKGETPVRQIYCMIRNPSSGINKLIKNGEYDKARIYYSENLENYTAWEGVKNSQAEFNLDTVERTSNWVYYKTGTFKGKVFNVKNPSDSVIIENGSFNFESFKFY